MPASAIDRVRLAQRAAALAVVLASAGSCTSVLALDHDKSAAASICALLGDCYAAGAPFTCVSRFEVIQSRDAGERDQWLRGVNGCLDNCGAARACLDDPLLCVGRGGACLVKEDCCDFTKGASDCDGRCCLPAGYACAYDEECCQGAGVCDPRTGTCGGTICREAGEPCDLGEQCCSGLCRDRACSLTICDPDGFECTDGASCCSGYCDAGRCGQPPTCGFLRAPCAADQDCCPVGEATSGFCYRPDGAPAGICTDAAGCAPIEADCSTGDQCCSGSCNPTYHKCGIACLGPQSACALDGECCSGHCAGGACKDDCSLAYCNVDADCCGGRCIGGTCGPACAAVDCSAHSVCDPGGPLDGTCAKGDGECALVVCAYDPYCCCEGWDSVCVAEAAAAVATMACSVNCP